MEHPENPLKIIVKYVIICLVIYSIPGVFALLWLLLTFLEKNLRQ